MIGSDAPRGSEPGWRFKIRKPLLMGTGQIWQARVYFRLRGRDFVLVSLIKRPLSKERLMGAKRTSRRDLLKGGAALAGGLTAGAAAPALGQTPASDHAADHDHPMSGAKVDHPMISGSKELIEYGQRSRFVTSVRIQHPVGGRPSPDAFGKTFHVASPLQDSVGVVTPSSLHYIATTRGAFLPDIDPKQHTLMIHGLVDRPLTFTMDDLKHHG